MRLALALAALSLAAAPAAAQRFGVTAGANFGSFSDARAVDFSTSTGYHVGVFGGVAVGATGLRVSAVYLRAGDATNAPCPEDAFCPAVVGDETPVDLVSVPVDLQLRFPLAVAAVYVGAGPDLRFPLRDGRPVFDTASVNVAATGLVGAEFSNVFLELRYATDVSGYARDLGAVDSDPDYRLNTFMVRAGIGI